MLILDKQQMEMVQEHFGTQIRNNKLTVADSRPGDWYTTMAIGEEDDCATTMAIGEE